MNTISMIPGSNKKEVIKSIVALAKTLPPVAEEYKQKTKLLGSEVKKMKHESWSKEQAGKVLALDDKKYYDLTLTRLRMVNAKRRMLDAFDKNGKDGIAKYLVWHNNQIKYLNEKYGDKKQTDLLTDKDDNDVEAED